MNNKLILLISLLSFGCAPDINICNHYSKEDLSEQITEFPVTVNLSSAFTGEDIKQAQEAVEEWNAAVDEVVFVINSDKGKGDCGYVEVISVKLPEDELGYTSNNNCNAKIMMTNVDKRIHEYYKETLMHELGHAIGLDHEDNNTSIMYAYVNDHDLRLTEKSIEHTWQVMHCFD